MLCSGNSSEYCGGSNRLDVYQVNGSLPVPTASPTSTPGTPSVVPSAGDFSYIGCFTDSGSNRALTGRSNPVYGATLTVEACAAACAGYTYFGVEYSAECYCGNSLMGGSALAAGGSNPTQNMCDMTCDGDTSEYCGGPNRLNTYQYNATLASASPTPTPTGPITVEAGVGFSYLGCYSDSVSSRALTGLSNPGSASQNTVEQCAAECIGFAYFGVEYGVECYCGNTITGGSALVAGDTSAMTGCDITCSGNALEFCGGANRLNLYHYAATVSSANTSSSATSSTLGTSSVSATLLPTSNSTSATASLSSFVSSSVNSTASSTASSSGIPSFSMTTLTSMMSSSSPSSTFAFPSSSANASSPAYTCLCV